MAARQTTADRDAITDVPGIRVGHWTNRRAVTGCTVVLCPPAGAMAACAVLGGAPGTRETDAMAPGNLVKRAHAVLLTGGSAFGLDAAGGVMRWLEERVIGFKLRDVHVPIVPAAVIYDLGIGRADVRPDAAAGYAACRAASARVTQGSVGAGTGATVAKLAGIERARKGGLGTASERSISGAVFGALVAVNAVGEVVDPDTGRLVAGMQPRGAQQERAIEYLRRRVPEPPAAGMSTTIAVIATDLELDREQLYRLALMGHTALARTLRPSHTPADGDTVFALATGERPAIDTDLVTAGTLAARALERAILNGVRRAASLGGVPSISEPHLIRRIGTGDAAWLDAFMERAWGAPVVVSRGTSYRPSELDGFVTEAAGAVTGVVTVHVDGEACEVVTLNAVIEGAGVGKALMEAAERYARGQGCTRLWLITTNDNTHAIEFYQRGGMAITAVRPGEIDRARALKPEIPLTGYHGIPIRDEIELSKRL